MKNYQTACIEFQENFTNFVKQPAEGGWLSLLAMNDEVEKLRNEEVTVIRTISYTGKRHRVEANLANRQLKGEKTYGRPENEVTMREAFVSGPERLLETLSTAVDIMAK